ncbi:ABC transporter substrate-binding protein [uncultured Cohaesibacter sp.]|uniref:ABC transporter substrate-binding protein n=1 Tax=uncultured Cohaesibacter sp. TaxID=1002546 RepID=UPI002AAC0592|nr:ABC transporter substrate-binding protein [uncultured Cohaesibacter sp.]
MMKSARKWAVAFSMAATLVTAGSTSAAWAARADIVLGVRLEPPHLDPTAGAAAAIDEITYANIFEGLTRIDKQGAVKPALAESWTISADGLTYDFKLHEGVKFHDGTDFDAEDVVFSLDRARGEDSVNAQKALFEPIDSVVAKDKYTVEMTLKRPTGAMLFNLGWGDAAMVAPESAETNKTNPVGTGPFKLEKWVKGDSITLIRNDAYWGQPAKLEKATFKIVADAAASLAALMAGDVDAFPIFPAPEMLPQFENDSRFKVVIGTTEGETILATNNGVKPFDDVRVRKALAYAINRQSLIDGAMFGYGTLIGSHFAPHNPAYLDLSHVYDYNPEKAKELLKEAGLEDGFKARLFLPPTDYARRSGLIIASDLKKVGIELELINVEWAQWLSNVFKGKDYDLTIISHTEPMDIGIYARDDYYFNYKNEEFKAIIAKLNATADEAERTELLHQAQKKLNDDAVNGFLFQLAKTGVWNAKIKGLWANAPIQANDLTAVEWMD